MFTKDQKVWCAIFGAGVVERIRQQSGTKYPVIVLFNNDNGDEDAVSYTADGKYHEAGNATLFPYPVEIVEADTKNLREALKTCQSKPQELKPSIDWSHVSPEYSYLAQDENEQGR